MEHNPHSSQSTGSENYHLSTNGNGASKCPFMSGKLEHAAGSGTKNRDWWPNQLKLNILRQHSSLSNPMGKDFDYAEAFQSLDLEALKKDDRFLRDGFLFAFLQRLSSKEIKAWSGWIARSHNLDRKPSNALELYRYLLLLKTSSDSEPDLSSSLDGRDLRAVLIEDDASPMRWFYRGVLPFYRCLDDLESWMHKAAGADQVRPVLQAFQRGDLISFGEIAGFGQPLKYSIRATQESGLSAETLRAMGQKTIPSQASDATPESLVPREESGPSLF